MIIYIVTYLILGLAMMMWHYRPNSVFVPDNWLDYVLAILIWPIIPIGHLAHHISNRKRKKK